MSLRRPGCSRERGARDAVRAQTHATGAAGPFEQVAPAPWLRETGRYDPRLVDMLIARLRTARPNHRDSVLEGRKPAR